MPNEQGQPQDAADATPPAWGFLNPYAELDIYEHGRLPHWQQGSVWYFITFRLADSIPRAIAERIKADREYWKKNHDANSLSAAEAAEYHRLFSKRYSELLDAAHGSCPLKVPENAKIVVDALRFFENKRYALDEYTVMPNHVHVLVKPLGEHTIAEILHSWKSHTAREINKRMGGEGAFWMKESYDHIVRNERAMYAIRGYIQRNGGIK